MTNSSVSNSSSSHSLSKLAVPVAKPAAECEEASDDLDEFGQQASDKLTHIVKTKQLNKRPPSFRRKKEAAHDAARSLEPPLAADIELESVSSRVDSVSLLEGTAPAPADGK